MNRKQKKNSKEKKSLTAGWHLGLVTAYLMFLLSSFGCESLEDYHEDGQETYDARIIGGSKAKIEQFPYIAGLKEDKFGLFCGAVIIDAEWVVTAQHCFGYFKTKDMYILAGTSNQTKNESGQVRRLAKVVHHPDFGQKRMYKDGNDITLLKLDKPLDLGTSKIKTIPLASPKSNSPYYSEMDKGLEKEGTIAKVAGWGIKKAGHDTPVKKLREARIEILEWDYGRTNWQFAANFKPHKSYIFAAYPNGDEQSTCNGDSGGPLVVEGRKGDVLVGLTSWGILECVSRTYPSAYTRISDYHSWIIKTTGINTER